ncbi:hypothetical protein REPUB_Repub18cG0045800 [Reevesia pubescens]
MLKAIEERNNRNIDDRFISVKKATKKWKKKKRLGLKTSSMRNKARVEMMKGDDEVEVESYQCKGKTSKSFESEGRLVSSSPREVNFDLDFSIKDMDWLDCCAIGRVKKDIRPMSLQDTLAKNGVQCKVFPMGGVFVLLAFQD